MKILLIECPREIAVLLETLLGSNACEISHCADNARAIAELRRERADHHCALREERKATGGGKDDARVVRAMGPRTSTDITTPGSPFCGVEWSKDGILQLHCRLHSVLHGNASARHVKLGSVEGFFFEYHAPCGKGWKRHG